MEDRTTMQHCVWQYVYTETHCQGCLWKIAQQRSIASGNMCTQRLTVRDAYGRSHNNAALRLAICVHRDSLSGMPMEDRTTMQHCVWQYVYTETHCGGCLWRIPGRTPCGTSCSACTHTLTVKYILQVHKDSLCGMSMENPRKNSVWYVWQYMYTHTDSVCLFVCLLVGCLTSQQQASVSQGRICSDNYTCCHTEIEVADQTFYLTQTQYTDTG